MLHKRYRTGFFLLITFVNSALTSQSTDISPKENGDPVIAVVLAGGGALGFAHVGALQVLEEEGIHPDIVIGTSMGSIVGGLYSVGYTPDEIEVIVRSTNWNETLTDSFVRKELSFDQKKRQADYILSYSTLKENRTSDAGLSHAQHVVELLDELLMPYSFELEFDTLPVRFRAVATDLQTGEMIVYRDGDLKTAIRASMSVPSVFTPVKYKGRFAIDGGWSENLPTALAKEMGADIIIAVSLFSIKDSLSELNTVVEVTDQAYQIRTVEKLTQSFKPADLLIAPALSGFTMADFGKSEALIALGYKAASGMRDQLGAIKAKQGDSTRSPRHSPGNVAFLITDVVADTQKDTHADRELETLILEELGHETTILDLQEYLYTLYDSGDYSHVWYQLIPHNGTGYTLVVDAPQKAHPIKLFSTAIDFTGQMIESSISDFTVKTAFQSWIGEDLRSSVALELWLSEFPSIQFSIDHQLYDTELLVSANAYLKQSAQYFFDKNTVSSVYSGNRAGGSFLLELPLLRLMEISLGLYSEYNWLDFRMGVEKFEEASRGRLGLQTIISIDTLDRIITPEKGIRSIFLLDGSFNTAEKPVLQAKMAGELYFPPFDGFIINPRMEVQSLLLGDLHPVELPTLGSAMIIHGYYLQELRADNVMLLGLNFRKRIALFPIMLGNEIYFQLAANLAAGKSQEVLRGGENIEYFLGGAAGIVANLVLGEFQINFGLNKDGRFSTFVGLSTSTSFYNEH